MLLQVFLCLVFAITMKLVVLAWLGFFWLFFHLFLLICSKVFMVKAICFASVYVSSLLASGLAIFNSSFIRAVKVVIPAAVVQVKMLYEILYVCQDGFCFGVVMIFLLATVLSVLILVLLFIMRVHKAGVELFAGPVTGGAVVAKILPLTNGWDSLTSSSSAGEEEEEQGFLLENGLLGEEEPLGGADSDETSSTSGSSAEGSLEGVPMGDGGAFVGEGYAGALADNVPAVVPPFLAPVLEYYDQLPLIWHSYSVFYEVLHFGPLGPIWVFNLGNSQSGLNMPEETALQMLLGVFLEGDDVQTLPPVLQELIENYETAATIPSWALPLFREVVRRLQQQ